MTTDRNNNTMSLAVLERVVVGGDLRPLTPAQRLEYYKAVCQSLELNPLTKPFAYIDMEGREGKEGKMVLYALKDATDQLRKKDKVSITFPSREFHDDLYIVTAEATLPDGRKDTSTGVVYIKGLMGKLKANALMTAETKAKRRVTLSICGLGWLDQTEVETISGASTVEVTTEGEIIPPPPPIAKLVSGSPIKSQTPQSENYEALKDLDSLRKAKQVTVKYLEAVSQAVFGKSIRALDLAQIELLKTCLQNPREFMELEAGDLDWEEFESDVLVATWSEWERMGGTVLQALSKLNAHRQGTSEEEAQA